MQLRCVEYVAECWSKVAYCCKLQAAEMENIYLACTFWFALDESNHVPFCYNAIGLHPFSLFQPYISLSSSSPVPSVFIWCTFFFADKTISIYYFHHKLQPLNNFQENHWTLIFIDLLIRSDFVDQMENFRKTIQCKK